MGKSLRRRSALEWSVRLTLALSAGLIGYLSMLHSLATALPSSQIERAYALAPYDGRIAARLSAVLSGPEASDASRKRAADVARLALGLDPTAVEAVSTLGTDALVRGNYAEAKHAFAYSQLLSRRDLRTQVWAIEDAVARGDIDGALTHYDIALRTEKSAPELLYPVLTSAISDPEIRQSLAATLAKKPLWGDDFISYIAINGSDPQAAAALYRNLRALQVPVFGGASSAVVNALVAADRPDEAWSYYSTLRKGVDRRRSRDADFARGQEYPSLFDWVSMNGDGISTAIQPSARGGVFDFAISPTVSGPLLQQFQILPSGQYLFEAHSTGIDQPEQSRPYWTLSCYGAREFGRIHVPNSSVNGGRVVGMFSVPTNCRVQMLTLVATSSNQITGVTGQIDHVSIRPSH